MSPLLYSLPSRAIPLDNSWDVIVVGGGPSGCAAAVAAAAEGARTLLIEASGALGGAGTGVLVPTWCPFSDKEKIIYRGLAQRVFETAKKSVPHVSEKATDWVPIQAESLKRIYDDLVIESGASVLFHTTLAGVEKKGKGAVGPILISNKSGLTAVQAKVYIDCTGDADLAAWAGADFQKGDESGAMQPATLCFVLTNVDEYAYRISQPLHPTNSQSPIYAILASGRYPEIPDSHLCDTLVAPRTIGFNAGHLWNIDNTDPWSTSLAMREGRKMAEAYRRALAEFVPEVFANAVLVSTGTSIGARETRRIMGDYVLTLEDYLERCSFSDEIGRNSYFIDLHFTQKEAGMKNRPDVEKRFKQYGPGESHGIPYRCLTPRGLKNVLVAGRSISCERVVHGSIRVMPVCLVTGEAAGVAAVGALKLADPDVHKVNVGFLRNRLLNRGAYLPPVTESHALKTVIRNSSQNRRPLAGAV